MMNKINEPIVYVVESISSRDMSDAKRFGQLRAVFTSPKKPYDTQMLMGHARALLENFTERDFLLFIGDPMLGAVCMSIASEVSPSINCLSWDRQRFEYTASTWHFADYFEDNNYNLFDNSTGE